MKKELYTNLKFILIFLVILTGIDLFLTAGLKKNTTGYYGKVNKIFKKDNLPQLAIFSSSVGEMGFDCSVLSTKVKKSCYNFSLSGTRFMQYKSLIDEINTTQNDIEYVVLAEAIFSLEKISALTELERFLPYLENENIYNNFSNVQPDLVFKSRYIPFYKYITVSSKYYIQSCVGWKKSFQKRNNNDTLLGQIKVNRKWESDQDTIWKYAKPIPINIDSTVFNIYKQTVKKLVQNHKKIVIVIPPIYMPKGQKIVDITNFRKTLSSICDNKNIFYFDFSESMVNKKYFYNVLHLNATGSALFSSMFADSLKTIL